MMQEVTMSQGLHQAPTKRDRNGGSLLSSTQYESDSDGSSCGQGGCLGEWITSLLGGVGPDGPSRATDAGADGTATATTTDDPTLLVAKELNQLSLQEREVVYEDLHGVSMVENESNFDLVNSRLHQMAAEIYNTPRSKKVAYLVALEECGRVGQEFCFDQELHKMFLRADRWDAPKAAARYVAFLDWKLKLFGRNVLCQRHVTLDVLDKDCRTLIQSGRQQILSQRDTSGRTITIDTLGSQFEMPMSVTTILQMFWYCMMALVEDDVLAQRMGIVYVIYTVGGSIGFKTADDRQGFWESSRMASTLPIRVNSVHYCFDNPKLAPVITLIQNAVGPNLRVRFRGHRGTHTEVQYSLMTYGIPIDVLPVTADGKLKTTNHLKWYNRRQVRDFSLAPRGGIFAGIDLPGRFDILLGKGKPIQESPGNRRLHELVRIYMEEYLSACHGDKQLIAEKVVRIVQDPSNPVSVSLVGGGGVAVCAGAPRFLKRCNDGWWEIVAHDVAVDKVCHSFRAARVALEAAAASSSGNNTKTSRTTAASGKGDRTGSATGEKRAKVMT